MITLDDLKPAQGSTRKSKKFGRGRASGHGKTSCRGANGEGQRAGRSSKRGFEGGQMPSYRQMPKLKGFKIINKIVYAQMNVSALEKLDLAEVTLESLKEAKKVHSSSQGLRIMGNGELKKAVTVKANYFTPSAKEKIEAAGGTVEVL